MISEKDKLQALSILAKDAGVPLLKRIGVALSPILDMLGLEMNYFKAVHRNKVMQRYAAKMKEDHGAALVGIAPEIGIPLLEAAKYQTNNDIQSLFAELLRKASLKDFAPFIHPRFADIVKSMSPIEAQIIDHLVKTNRRSIPFLATTCRVEAGVQEFTRKFYSSEDDKLVKTVGFEEGLYNLVSLGILVEQRDRFPVADTNRYTAMKKELEIDAEFQALLLSWTKKEKFSVADYIFLNQAFCISLFGNLFVTSLIDKEGKVLS